MTIATIDAIPPTTEPAIVALSDGLSPDPEFVDGDGVEDEDEDAVPGNEPREHKGDKCHVTNRRESKVFEHFSQLQ